MKNALEPNGGLVHIVAFGHILKLGWVKAYATVEIVGADIDQLIGLFFEEVVGTRNDLLIDDNAFLGLSACQRGPEHPCAAPLCPYHHG